MKKTINSIVLLTFFALLTFTSCQDDSVEVNVPNDQETIVPNSALAELMLNTSASDGSLDNILDNTNCIAVNLPVTIVANGITITINSLEDLELIEAIFEEFENDSDVLEFLFPITVILNDYTEVTINNEDELEAFIDDCEDTIDDDIECVDFQYPISFSLYDSDFQITETVVIENDEALYEFLEGLSESEDGVVLASLNFPVTLVYANGETIVVNTNAELETAINAAQEECDDDDDEDCNEEDVAMYLQECHWRIAAYNGDDVFQDLYLFFNANEEFKIYNGTTAQYIEGNWTTSISNDGHVEIVISELNGFQEDLGGSWIVLECEDDRFELTRELDNIGTTTMVIEQECEDDLDCSAQEISMYLQECLWYAGTNLYENVVAEEFHFGENNGVEVINSATNQLTDTGTWEVSLSDQGVFVSLNFQIEPLNLFNRDWRVIECDEDRIKMINGDDYIVFERDCNTSSPFECFIGGDEIVECSDSNDGYATFDLREGFAECTQPPAIILSYFETIADADNNVNPIANPDAYTNTSNPQTIYVRVDIGDDHEVFELVIYAENCGATCSEEDIDAYVVECHWNVVNYNGSDDLIIFDLDFNADGSLVIEGDGQNITASWSTSQTGDGAILEFSNVAGANIQAITGNWLVVECNEERLELTQGDNFMVIERDCN